MCAGCTMELFGTASGKFECKEGFRRTKSRSDADAVNQDPTFALADAHSRVLLSKGFSQSSEDFGNLPNHDCARSPNHFAFGRRTSSVGATELPEWPEEDSVAMARGRSLLHTLSMDSTRFTSGDLCGLLLELFQEAGLPEELPISSVKRLILAVREHMYDNPYHNFFHVFDVCQTVYVLSMMTLTLERLDAWERFALLAAALCHDLEHPGVDKGFMERAALRDAFRDDQLEKHHTLRAFEIMADSEIGVLQGISTARYYAFRQAVNLQPSTRRPQPSSLNPRFQTLSPGP